jgi:ferrochelatase
MWDQTGFGYVGFDSFVSDHMEVMFDLDEEAKETAEELGLGFARAKTAGTHPKFVKMIRDLIFERWSGTADRPCIGSHPACHDVCPKNCCLPGEMRPATVPVGERPAT